MYLLYLPDLVRVLTVVLTVSQLILLWFVCFHLNAHYFESLYLIEVGAGFAAPKGGFSMPILLFIVYLAIAPCRQLSAILHLAVPYIYVFQFFPIWRYTFLAIGRSWNLNGCQLWQLLYYGQVWHWVRAATTVRCRRVWSKNSAASRGAKPICDKNQSVGKVLWGMFAVLFDNLICKIIVTF